MATKAVVTWYKLKLRHTKARTADLWRAKSQSQASRMSNCCLTDKISTWLLDAEQKALNVHRRKGGSRSTKRASLIVEIYCDWMRRANLKIECLNMSNVWELEACQGMITARPAERIPCYRYR